MYGNPKVLRTRRGLICIMRTLRFPLSGKILPVGQVAPSVIRPVNSTLAHFLANMRTSGDY